MAGMVGHGDAFVMRDPAGIRPAYYYVDDEVVGIVLLLDRVACRLYRQSLM